MKPVPKKKRPYKSRRKTPTPKEEADAIRANQKIEGGGYWR